MFTLNPLNNLLCSLGALEIVQKCHDITESPPRYSFYEAGFIKDIHFVTKNVSTTKYYERILDFERGEGFS